MVFPKGITGFGPSLKGKDAPAMSEALLHSLVHFAAQMEGYRVAEIEPPRLDCNYYRAVLKGNAGQADVDLVFNAVYPYFAAIGGGSVWMQMEWVDAPAGLRGRLEPQFTYLPPELLQAAFSGNDLVELFPSEIKQIQYWETRTYGDAIFNGYD